MKKILAMLLALVMVLALAACGEQGGTPSGGNTDTPGSSQGDSGDGNDNGSGSKEDCVLCIDVEGNDRKCDTCGKWIYPDGEAWTDEVPDNLKVTVEDSNFCYVVEKIGEEVYVKMWSDKSEMDKGETPYEDFIRLTESFTRFKGNAAQAEWSKTSFQTKYADVYELFAVKVLQSLSGTTISNVVDDCKDVVSSGTEKIAGKDCVIKEYEGLFGTKYKVWFWNNMPMKRMYQDQNMDKLEVMFEIHEWDDTITSFSSDMPS